ncbi:sodium ion-translocating decarboxylase subunit beta [Candidatus Cryosericum hinesii]|jgi:sodium ion-translocating decarboxylase beta subunit|uniref:Sodium ion-translocating decarboxylase subunit beta n=2 Tax=Candidatus Cryosericum hinesii TaxID=2290915 RepID=A0ABX9MI66_9BACT|nr:sodium ion-translocating decarboxylase subunit beta [Candidatus Cryosericum hinesii]RIE10963.1 sodium ion-translocating decarboxylase subunit beta [Candidatus Cryosericum hinesii]RIE15249.1 sodium ion-translocating decarboxylase subunit beta [Candidatus Cryosericum hinesii]
MSVILAAIKGFRSFSGIYNFTWGNAIMLVVALVLMYLAIAKDFEPILLLPIAFGCFLANIPAAKGSFFSINPDYVRDLTGTIKPTALLDFFYFLVKSEILPPLIFLGIGAMTDFGPLLANPVSLLLGASAQFGVFVAMVVAKMLQFSIGQAGAIGIIGGADGPTAIYTATKLAPELLGPIAVAAYTYMSLVPLIQPPIMRLLSTHEMRSTVMEQLRPVGKLERILFPIVTTFVIAILLPPVGPLVGMLMLGNLLRESGVVERLSNTAANELINICTLFLAVAVGASMNATSFLNLKTLYIIGLGVIAFGFSTAGGMLLGDLMWVLSGHKINPLIGSAGVSAVPMAARVSQKVGQKDNPANFLLMHAMGPNVAGVIGTAVAAGIMISLLGH